MTGIAKDFETARGAIQDSRADAALDRIEAALVTLAADSEDAVWNVAGEAQRLHDREPAVQELIAAAREVRYIGGLDRLRAALKNLEEA